MLENFLQIEDDHLVETFGSLDVSSPGRDQAVCHADEVGTEETPS